MKPCLLGHACGKFSDPSLESAPLWLKHHIPIFGSEHIFVVGNHVDPSIFNEVNFIRRDHPEGAQIDMYWQAAVLYEWITRLRNTYFTVITMEMDEFLCLERPLGEVLKGKEQVPCYRLEGYDVVHDVFREPPVDLSLPVLSQRRWWVPTSVMSKPSIFNSSLAPSLGGHSLAGVEPEEIPIIKGMKLVHLKRMDYSMCFRRLDDRVKNWKWTSVMNCQSEKDQTDTIRTGFDNWFLSDVERVQPIQDNFLSIP